METRANYLLIGAFTLAGILGALGLFLWLAKVELDRQFSYYDILFEDVTGLSQASDVRYNGLRVGQVVQLALHEADPGRIRVRIEVAADTPVKTDTVATLEYQGVTGVTYVSLAGGTPESAPLRPGPGEEVPVVQSERSAVQTLFQVMPELLERSLALMDGLGEVMSDENREAFDALLANLASASGRLDAALGDFSELSAQLGEASAAIAGFSETLDTVADGATTTLETADETLRTAREAIEQGRATIGEATGALASARQTFDSANALIGEQLPGLVDRVESTAGTIETTVGELGTRAGGVADRLDRMGELAVARLAEAEATLARLDTALETATATMASLGETAGSVEALAEGEAAALLAEARRAIATAEATMEAASGTLASARQTFDSADGLMRERLPGLIERADGTLATIDSVAAEVGAKAGDMAERVGRLADTANARMAQAEATLARLDTAIDTATATLESVDRTAGSIDRTARSVDTLVSGEGAALVADTRQAVGTAAEAITAANRVIQEDLPAIVANVRGATETVNTVVARLGEDFTDISGRMDGLAEDAMVAIGAATETFRGANDTLAAVTRTMDTAQGTLSAAEGTFGRVNRLVDEDVSAILADVRGAVAGLDTALAQVSADLPVITGEVRATLERASSFVNNMDRLVVDNSEQIEAFMQAGLPQFVRFVEEASRLIVNLQRLTSRIEKNPARFLLGTQSPEFER